MNQSILNQVRATRRAVPVLFAIAMLPGFASAGQDDLTRAAVEVNRAAIAMLKGSRVQPTTVVAQDRIIVILGGPSTLYERKQAVASLKSLVNARWKGLVEVTAGAGPDYGLVLNELEQLAKGLVPDKVAARLDSVHSRAVLSITGTAKKDAAAALRDQLLIVLKDYPGVELKFVVQEPEPQTKPIIATSWPLRFFHGEDTLDGLIRPAEFVKGLNFALGNDGKDPNQKLNVAEFQNGRVWLRGQQEQVNRARSMLCLFDTPDPAVDISAWAFQFTGKSNSVNETIAHARKQIEASQLKTELITLRLHQAMLARDAQRVANNQPSDPLIELIQAAGIELRLDRPLSLLQLLVRLGVSRDRLDVLKHASTLIDPKGGQNVNVFPNLTEILAESHLKSDRQSVVDFLEAALYYDQFRATLSGEATDSKVRQGPEGLQARADVVDRHFEHLIAAYARDLNAYVMEPLVTSIRNAGGGAKTKLNGRVSILVTSGRAAETKPELVSYGQTQVVKNLDDTFFKMIAPKGVGDEKTSSETTTTLKYDKDGTLIPPKDGEAATTTTTKTSSGSDPGSLEGLTRILAGMPSEQAALVAAAFSAPVEQKFVKVSPGVALSVTPVVGPDHLGAALKIHTHFGIATSLAGGASDEGKYSLPDAVTKHDAKTVARTNGFSLTSLSTLDLESTVPRPATVVPFLGQLPILGPMFRFPRRPDQVHHQSMILVSSTIVPRTLGLFKYYSSDASDPRLLTALRQLAKDGFNGTKLQGEAEPTLKDLVDMLNKATR